MRTRSGSLAAIMARVPSHPAHCGVLCICAERANSPRDTRSASCTGFGNTADGVNAQKFNMHRPANSAFGWFSLFANLAGDFNTGAGAGTLALNQADSNTAVGAAALILNVDGSPKHSCGTGAMVNNAGDTDGNGSFNDAVGAFALNSNTTGFSNNAVGDSALFRNELGSANTAVGDLALENNDATGNGDANFNTAVGASALFNNVGGSSNTGVGAGVGPNLVQGFNNTYVGQFVGTNAADEDLTIRIGDISADGFGSAACYIGGIFNNPQPVGGNVVVVTLNLDTDQLGFDGTASGGNAPAAPHRNAPQPRIRPQPAHQATLNDKVEKLSNGHAAAERNRDFDRPAQRAGRANRKSECPA